jgi:lipopolysaccharide/colanic/teichoic acid biosynthesis glycosyltransferase
MKPGITRKQYAFADPEQDRDRSTIQVGLFPRNPTKTAIDFLGAIILLTGCAPLFALISCMLILESPRSSVIFRQTRSGLEGRPFTIFKFRTLRDISDKNLIQVQLNDPRVTAIGKVLRRTSLDELPQLINVLRGEMSLVGPRPHAVQHDEYYSRTITQYELRYTVKPGMTGWAQVNGLRGATSNLRFMEERVRYDLEYISNWSVILDIKILFLTILAVLKGTNAH